LCRECFEQRDLAIVEGPQLLTAERYRADRPFPAEDRRHEAGVETQPDCQLSAARIVVRGPEIGDVDGSGLEERATVHRQPRYRL